MRDLVELRRFYRLHIGQQDLVLCTMVGKKGSSYRSLGAKKIVAANGASCGFLSGGCLEASIEKSALTRKSEMPFTESFSTLSEQDRLLGFQTGCRGVIRILFEKMDSSHLDLMIPFGVNPKGEGVCVHLNPENLGHHEFARKNDVKREDFFDPWIEPIQLVLIGCGPDAVPYLALSQALGWSLRMIDYRKRFAKSDQLRRDTVDHIPIEAMRSAVPEGRKVAVVLMTHNYEGDLEILRQLRSHRIGYLGCLGPARRFRLLQEDMFNLYQENLSDAFKNVCYAPAGIFSRGQSPSEIAFSIVAQIQESLIESHHPRNWTLILAAGGARRFGSPKALAYWRGQTLLSRALQTASQATGDRVMIVTGGHADSLTEYLQNYPSIHNNFWTNGMGGSIALGVAAIRERDEKAESIAILPVDQPLVEPEHLMALHRESRVANRCALTTNAEGITGAPAAIPKSFFERTRELQGDRGMKSVLKNSEIIFVENSKALFDVDSPEDLSSLENLVPYTGG